MRIGAAAHAGGDLPTALGVYRRAAAIEPRSIAPYVAAGNTLLELGQFNEAIVTYHSALEHDPRDPEALRGQVASSHPASTTEPSAKITDATASKRFIVYAPIPLSGRPADPPRTAAALLSRDGYHATTRQCRRCHIEDYFKYKDLE
jgi:tetratricopeptide (TPR) repeat protein